MSMKFRRPVWSLPFAILLLLAPAQAASAQPGGCGFVGGFQLLHDLIPDLIGSCLENEHFNPSNGNSEQRTSGGLLVWRKADNWTAFTDGGTTWINGPYGLQSRANGDTFPWEPAGTQAVTTQPVAPASPNLGMPPLYTGQPGGTTTLPPTIPSTGQAPATSPPTTEASTTDDTPGPLTLKPESALLQIEDMGKEITQKERRTGSDARGSWAFVRFERSDKYANAHFGPIKTYARVFVAHSIGDAQAVFVEEVSKQRQFPEADRADRVGGTFVLEGLQAYGDEQDELSACSPSCDTSKQVTPHHRAVFRQQNAVVTLYFFGAKDSAQPDVDQANEWLTKLRDRLG